MSRITPSPDSTVDTASYGGRLSRRRLFELGGAGAVLAAVLAACGGDDGEPGRVGVAPVPTPLPEEEVDDAVFLRTMTSLEQSILAVYARLAADAGLGGAGAAALERFIADHQTASDELVGLTTAVGGEPFECPNPWYEARFFGPTLDNVFGGGTSDTTIPVSDDVARDAIALMHALESLSTSSYLRFVELASTPQLRGEMARLGARAARRAATIALIGNPPPDGYVAPSLLEADAATREQADTTPAAPATTEASETTAPGGTSADGGSPAASEPLPNLYALNTRFAQLVAVSVQVGAVNDLGLRFTTSYETPAENAYVYASHTCRA